MEDRGKNEVFLFTYAGADYSALPEGPGELERTRVFGAQIETSYRENGRIFSEELKQVRPVFYGEPGNL